MRSLPLSARIYVGAVVAIGALLVVSLGPTSTFASPLPLRRPPPRLGRHLRLQGQPAARQERLDDVGVVRGRLRVAAAARPERDDARRGGERVEPVHVPDEGERNPLYRTLFSMACLVITVQAAGVAYAAARRRARRARHDVAGAAPSRSSARRRPTSSSTRCLIATPIALSTRQPIVTVWNENFLWSAPSYFVGAGAAARRRVAGHRASALLAGAARRRAALPHLPHLQGLPRPHRGRAAARARRWRTCTWRRSKRWRSRSTRRIRRRSRTSGACRSTPPALARGARHVRERDPGRQDRGAAARHRQARRARAHPVEAGPADAGRVPEDPRPPAGRRRDHQRRAVPVSRWRRSSSATTSAGTARAIRRASRARRFRSARASCRSSTTSTR